MATSPVDALIGQTIGSYVIVARVGGGGMGVVYQARDTRLGRIVALKFLPPQWSHDDQPRQRFVREAQAASATSHPNICTIHDIETAPDGQLFIVMAYYEGQTLKQRLASGPLASDEALDIATQIADGLAKAHAQNVVHRDIKPGNVMLTEDGVRIVDFGLATFADALKLTAEHSTLGTVAYMSPEQVRGLAADARSDVWAVGVILYEMLTGRVPFQGSHAEAIAYAIRNETPAPIRASRPDVAEEIEHLVFRAMHKEPGIRFANGRELSRALRQVRGHSIPPDFRTEPVVVPKPAADGKRRHWKIWAAAAAVIVVAVGGGLAYRSLAAVQRIPIAIAPVVNQTGYADLDPYRLALTLALITDLSESPNVRVLSYPRLLQIVRRFIASGTDVSSRDAVQAVTTVPADLDSSCFLCSPTRGAMACTRRDSGCVNLNDGGSRRDRCRVVVDRQGHRVYADGPDCGARSGALQDRRPREVVCRAQRICTTAFAGRRQGLRRGAQCSRSARYLGC